jgi:hypothetical protein
LLWLYWRWGLKNYSSTLALNCDPPILSLPSSQDYRCESPCPGRHIVFLVILRLELRAYTLSHSTRPFCEGFYWDKFSRTICPGWLWTEILLISASWLAGITGVVTGTWQILFIFWWYWGLSTQQDLVSLRWEYIDKCVYCLYIHT